MSDRLDALRHREAELSFQRDIASGKERGGLGIMLAEVRADIREQLRRDEAGRPAREHAEREERARSARRIRAVSDRMDARSHEPRIYGGRIVR